VAGVGLGGEGVGEEEAFGGIITTNDGAFTMAVTVSSSLCVCVCVCVCVCMCICT
jgi:hypothetical protein